MYNQEMMEADLQRERKERPGRTPLQMHCDFFDRNRDGMLTPWETFKGTFALIPKDLGSWATIW